MGVAHGSDWCAISIVDREAGAETEVEAVDAVELQLVANVVRQAAVVVHGEVVVVVGRVEVRVELTGRGLEGAVVVAFEVREQC